MSLRRIALVSVITASSWLMPCAKASDAPAVPPPAAPPQQTQPAASGTADASHPANKNISLSRPGGWLPAGPVSAMSASSRPAASKPLLNLNRGPVAPRTGWEMSGRLGPLRWLAPLEGDGETQVRLGGRLPNQPRMPNMPPLNVGIHYSFE